MTYSIEPSYNAAHQAPVVGTIGTVKSCSMAATVDFAGIESSATTSTGTAASIGSHQAAVLQLT